MTKAFRLTYLLALVFALSVFGCGQSTPAPQEEAAPPEAAPQETAAPKTAAQEEAASLPTSATAAATEAKLAEETPALEPGTLPPDHWLVGTSDVPDMVPAVIAPEAPRTLLREHGPAYLEQVGLLRILHLKGSHYDMGVQHGTLMAEEIRNAAALIKMVGSMESGDFGVTIREAWDRTSPFIPDKYKEEIRGMAEATGLSIEEVQDFTIFPELFHCSGFAFWGKATADGELLHGRVLDYMRDIGLDKYALVIVHEPESANAVVNIAYSGMIGSVTGMNNQHVAIGEMGGGGEGNWDGMPMSILVRECLEMGDTLEDVRRMMEETPRTCQYYYCVSDSKVGGGPGSAFGVAAEPDSIIFIEPNQAHPMLARPVEDAVLMSAGDRYQCLVDRVEKMHGQITPQIALDIMARGVSMSSNMHDCLFKPATLEIWVANSTVESPACNLPYTHLDMATLMSEKPAS